ncbi:hypothetical protein [Sinimarinibacterium flocculans]|uniref:hypothetical protein n=1 Tax=Sinimarinibacterium flocculans TaxID=985250 RepID=UPI003514BB45
MAIWRQCKQCKAHAVRRSQRSIGQRALAWVVPIRPQHCTKCGHQSWGLLHADDPRGPFVTSALFWAVLILVLFPWNASFVRHGTQALRGAVSAVLWPEGSGKAISVHSSTPAGQNDVADEAVIVAAAEASAPAVLQTPDLPASTALPTIAPVAVAAPTLVPTPTPTSVPAPTAAPTPAAGERPMRLDGVDVRWTGEAMEVVVRSGDALEPSLRFSDADGGYVIDLPGRWSLADGLRLSRTFTRSNLAALHVGRNPKFLRVVLGLGDPSAPAPTLEVRDEGLWILVH